jgi:hypothetical protein
MRLGIIEQVLAIEGIIRKWISCKAEGEEGCHRTAAETS